jgi:hypothetical protein
MKKFAFALTGSAVLALGACNKGNEDAVNNVELNQPSADELNEQANQAAMDAANLAAAAQANMHAEEQNAAQNLDNPSDDEEQNVSGM